jgi:hypothetical protein
MPEQIEANRMRQRCDRARIVERDPLLLHRRPF